MLWGMILSWRNWEPQRITFGSVFQNRPQEGLEQIVESDQILLKSQLSSKSHHFPYEMQEVTLPLIFLFQREKQEPYHNDTHLHHS